MEKNLYPSLVQGAFDYSSSTSKIWYTSILHDVHYVVEKFCTKGYQSLLSLLGTREKNFSFQFKCYNLTICVVNFFETFYTCFPSTLRQDLIVKIAKKKMFFFCLDFLSYRNGRFEFFFLEKKELHPLGFRPWICVFLIFKIYILNYSDGLESNECAYHSDILKYDYCYFYGYANFCLYTLYFSKPINIWEFVAPCFTT